MLPGIAFMGDQWDLRICLASLSVSECEEIGYSVADIIHHYYIKFQELKQKIAEEAFQEFKKKNSCAIDKK